MANRRCKGAVAALGSAAARTLRAPARPFRALALRYREARRRELERMLHARMSEWNAAALRLHDQAACAEDE